MTDRERRQRLDAETMKEIAAELELSQADVGLLLGGYDQATVSGWFSGKGTVRDLIRHIFTCPKCRKHFLEDRALLR